MEKGLICDEVPVQKKQRGMVFQINQEEGVGIYSSFIFLEVLFNRFIQQFPCQLSFPSFYG